MHKPAATAKELQVCQQLCDELRAQIKNHRDNTNGSILTSMSKQIPSPAIEIERRNMCTGHFGKIYALHWGPDSMNIVTASQDGKLIIWGALSGNKQLAITLNSAWVMTCAFSPSYHYIASGGLDNTVSIFQTTAFDDSGAAVARFRSKELYRELEKHDGYLSCARFLDDNQIISASGDSTCILWDVDRRQLLSTMVDHTGDVMSIDLNRETKGLFCSGSVDATAKVWDCRTSDDCISNFPGHLSDINTVRWFPDSQSIITGSDDGTVRLFDMRSYRQINTYSDIGNKSLHSQDCAGVTSVDVSGSGRYIFAAYDNGQVYVWDSLKSERVTDLPHQARVSSLAVCPNGYALATGCWDFNLQIFA